VDGVHDAVAGSRVERIVRRLGPGQRRSGGVELEVVENAPADRDWFGQGDGRWLAEAVPRRDASASHSRPWRPRSVGVEIAAAGSA